MLRIIKYPSDKVLKTLFARPSTNNIKVSEDVKAILENVRTNGDKALKEYSKK